MKSNLSSWNMYESIVAHMDPDRDHPDMFRVVDRHNPETNQGADFR